MQGEYFCGFFAETFPFGKPICQAMQADDVIGYGNSPPIVGMTGWY